MIADEDDAHRFIQQGWGDEAFALCAAFVEELRQENERQNLVSAASLDSVWVRHVADSAQFLCHAPEGWTNWIDIGTGAGFPGLVIALLHPHRTVVLVEPRRLRAEWLRAIVRQFDLKHCRVEERRAEALPDASYDVVSARAVASLTELLRLTARLGQPDCCWIFAKGRNLAAERAALPPSLARSFMFHVKHSLTAPDANLIVCTRAKDRS